MEAKVATTNKVDDEVEEVPIKYKLSKKKVQKKLQKKGHGRFDNEDERNVLTLDKSKETSKNNSRKPGIGCRILSRSIPGMGRSQRSLNEENSASIDSQEGTPEEEEQTPEVTKGEEDTAVDDRGVLTMDKGKDILDEKVVENVSISSDPGTTRSPHTEAQQVWKEGEKEVAHDNKVSRYKQEMKLEITEEEEEVQPEFSKDEENRVTNDKGVLMTDKSEDSQNSGIVGSRYTERYYASNEGEKQDAMEDGEACLIVEGVKPGITVNEI